MDNAITIANFNYKYCVWKFDFDSEQQRDVLNYLDREIKYI